MSLSVMLFSGTVCLWTASRVGSLLGTHFYLLSAFGIGYVASLWFFQSSLLLLVLLAAGLLRGCATVIACYLCGYVSPPRAEAYSDFLHQDSCYTVLCDDQRLSHSWGPQSASTGLPVTECPGTLVSATSSSPCSHCHISIVPRWNPLSCSPLVWRPCPRGLHHSG